MKAEETKIESHKIGGRQISPKQCSGLDAYMKGRKLMLPQKYINIHPIEYLRVRCDNLGCLSPQMCPEFLS